MATDDEPQPPNSGAVKRIAILRCKLCERTIECPSADQIRSAQTERPLCCGRVMELFIQSGQPTSPDVDGGRDADSYKLNPGGQRS